MFFVFCFNSSFCQLNTRTFLEHKKDSITKNEYIKQLGNGYFPTKYFNLDLRYLLKYNQYEGIRTGLGGITNNTFSKNFRINSYIVYGFRDDLIKYQFGTGLKLIKKSNTWLNIHYIDDLQETGSTQFLTDGRFFQLFQPRLLNISLFHKHLTKSIFLEHQFSNKAFSTTELATSKITPTYTYNYKFQGQKITSYYINTLKTSFQWNPFSRFKQNKKGELKTENAYPKFTIQYTKSLKGFLQNNFNFSKIDFRAIHRIGDEKNRFSEIILNSGLTDGDIPLTHLYHASPNNISKETILQRFSVAGLNSFETMFFNEFFSDKFSTIQFKHFLKPFKITSRYKPQLVLITRYAIGSIKNPERHENITFNSLKKGYTESGFEINKLFFGFGLNFTYRYGAYHLANFDDNIAFKFTFNLTL